MLYVYLGQFASDSSDSWLLFPLLLTPLLLAVSNLNLELPYGVRPSSTVPCPRGVRGTPAIVGKLCLCCRLILDGNNRICTCTVVAASLSTGHSHLVNPHYVNSIVNIDKRES